MATGIKISSLNPIGANIAYTTLVPVVNMSGVPTTEKATAQVLGNLILNGAGGSYFPAAAQAVLAQSVTNAAQPNITSVGTLTSLDVTGTVSAEYFVGDGSFLTNVAIYSDSNVANYLPTYNGIVGANRISSNSNGIQIDANGAVFTFGEGGALYWPAGSEQWVIEPNIDNEFEIKSTSNIVISTDISNANSHFTFDIDGVFTAPSNVNLLGSRLNVGPDALNATTLLNPTLIIANTGAQFIQAAIINNDASGSSDWAAEGAGGGDDEAWIDMGFAGYSFNDANYTITGPGDGYVFVQAYANGLGGNMVFATGTNSNTADIIFATGGFSVSDEFARIDHTNSLLHLTRTGSGIKFNDGTIQSTAATGNIITVNLDGNVSNVLAGNGTFVALPVINANTVVWTTAPVSNTSTGTAGEAAYDSGGNLFVCVATDTWAKFTGTTSW